MTDFGTYNNWGRDMGGLSVNNPELYRWYYRELKADEKPLFGNKQRKENTQVGLEELDGPVEMDDILAQQDIKTKLTQYLLKLKPREERVIREMFFYDKTLEEVGKTFCVTRERVRLLKCRGLQKLKNQMIKDGVTFLDLVA